MSAFVSVVILSLFLCRIISDNWDSQDFWHEADYSCVLKSLSKVDVVS